MKTQFTSINQVWAAIDAGKTVHWASTAYTLTVEDSMLDWRKQQGFEVPFSNRNGQCLRVTCTENYFGSLLLESELPKLFELTETL